LLPLVAAVAVVWPRCYTCPPKFGVAPKEYSMIPDATMADGFKVLGKGAYGAVYAATDQAGVTRAVKVIPMWRMQLDNQKDQLRAKVEEEIDVYQHIGINPNIVPLLDSIDIQGDVGDFPRWKMVVMEIANGGELKDLIEAKGKIPEPPAKVIFQQIADAVSHLHGQNVEYRTRPFGIRKYAPGPGGLGARIVDMIEEERYPKDPLGQAWTKGVKTGWVVKSVAGVDVTNMKFDDILDLMGDRLLDNASRGAFDGSYAVTGDNKGKGKVLPKVEQVDLPATIEYLEINAKTYGVKVDVWSLGVVLYQMLAGQSPFPAEEAAVLAGNFAPVSGASAEANDLISKMLVVDPAARIDMAAVKAHPWVR